VLEGFNEIDSSVPNEEFVIRPGQVLGEGNEKMYRMLVK
jgi:hypothetical protein